ILFFILGSLIYAFAFNFFLVPHEILSSGISSIAILLSILTPFDTGIYNFILNIPLLILGYFKLGRAIVINTLVCVFSLSLFLFVLPVMPITDNMLLSTVFGGGIGGIGVGLILKFAGRSEEHTSELQSRENLV